MLRCRREAVPACMSADVDEEVWRVFFLVGGRSGWVGCLMDGQPPPPHLFFVSLPPADEQAHYYGAEIKKGRPFYLLTVHFEPSTKGVYSFPTPARGYVTPTQVAPCQCFHWAPSPPPPPPPPHTGILPKTLSRPQTQKILACQRTETISTPILSRCCCQQI